MVSNCPRCQIVLLAWSVSDCPFLHDGVKLSQVSNCPRYQIVRGVKIFSLHSRCQIVLFCMMVSNCPRCQIVLLAWSVSNCPRCQIVPSPNQQLLYYVIMIYGPLIFLKRSSRLVEFVDIFPTLVEAAGM